MNFYQFASANPILTFVLFYIAGDVVIKVVRRFIRHLNIRAHGWPPEHLDADGDFKETNQLE
jgi:hypothetical protein